MLSLISVLHDEAELENCFTEKEAKYHKVCANHYDKQKLQRLIGNQKSISEADNSVEPSPSLSCSLYRKTERNGPEL